MNLAIATNNINNAYQYLRSIGKVHTQKELASIMSSTPPNVSKALAGDEKCLTEKFISRFNLSFGNIFRLSWLLDGEGVMLNNYEDKNEVVFEYNEKEGKFRDNPESDKENTNGYKTICKTTYAIWDPFRNRIRILLNHGKILSHQRVVDMWNEYINSSDEYIRNIKNEDNGSGIITVEHVSNNDFSLVPLINIDSVGGMDSTNALASGDQFVERLIPFTGAQEGDRAIYQSGDSMTPTIPPGSILQIRKIDDWQEYFGYGGIFVLWLKDDRRITKQVMKYSPDPKNYVTCHSFNPDAADEELPKRFIREVWKVIKVLTDKGW